MELFIVWSVMGYVFFVPRFSPYLFFSVPNLENPPFDKHLQCDHILLSDGSVETIARGFLTGVAGVETGIWWGGREG